MCPPYTNNLKDKFHIKNYKSMRTNYKCLPTCDQKSTHVETVKQDKEV